MDRVLYCIARDHDWRITLLSALLCLIGLASAFRLMERARVAEGSRRRHFTAAAAMTASLAIWGTHFLAMQGFIAGVEVTYSPAHTLLSLLIALIVVSLAVAVTLHHSDAARSAGKKWRVMGALTGAAGLASMHYMGMAGLRVPAILEWDTGLVIGSLVISFIIAALGALVYQRDSLASLLGASLLCSLGVISLHFTGMTALIITPDPSLVFEVGLSARAMQIMVAVVIASLAVLAGILIFTAYMARSNALSRIREAVDAMPDGLGFFDVDDRLILWNQRYAEVNPELAPHLRVGVTFRELLQIGINEGMYDDAIGNEEAWIAERMKQRRQPSSSMEQLVSGNRWLRVQDRRTQEGSTVTLCNEITDLKRNAEALAEARDAAEAANIAKSNFLANMSHEIRTPLNGVIGLAQALSNTDVDAEQREILDLIQSSGRTLQTLLTDILDLARVESGKLELNEDAFHLPGAVREAARLYAENAREKHLDYNIDINVDESLWVRGDMVRLKQILTNLISNALKFTSQGFVSLTVQNGPARNGQETLQFIVEDTGIGFDAATRERLFQRFEQADGGITRKFGGSGLGLSICQQLATMMGGSLDCESEQGSGSCFILTLPLNQIESPQPHESQAQAEQEKAADSRPPRVLVADDHPTNQRVIELILNQIGAEMVMAADGVQALEAYRTRPFDLILMDMQMPVMDGLTATQEIRLHETTLGLPHTPLVMLTANAMPEHVAASRAAGADHHLSKPFNAADLLAIVADPTSLIAVDRLSA